MAGLFQTSKQSVSLPVNNIFKKGELLKEMVVKEFFTTMNGVIEGKFKRNKIFLCNLDVIVSVGHRVKIQVGTRFR